MYGSGALRHDLMILHIVNEITVIIIDPQLLAM